MLTGPDLGRAIEAARIKMGITKKDLADRFGVTPPSIQAWVRRGTIEKDKLFELFEFFSTVVGPEHWGIPQEAASLIPIVTRHSTEPIEAALVTISHALAALPVAARKTAAMNLAAWAEDGGAKHYVGLLTALLQPPGKRHRQAA